MKLTIVIIKGEDGFLIGQIKEIPEVITQGLDIEEVKTNIKDALKLYFDDMRSEKSNIEGEIVSEEDLILA